MSDRRRRGPTALTNGRLLLPTELVTDRAVVIDDRWIAAVIDADSVGDMETLDVGGRYISPGLIDLHIHGAVNCTFSDASAPSFESLTKETAKHGITALLATLVSAPIDDLVKSLSFTKCWTRERHEGSQILGVHLEGPYLSMGQKGAQDSSSIRSSVDASHEILMGHHEVIRMMTLAPELPGALELIGKLTEHGIVVAAGHSSCSDADLVQARQFGLRHVAHLWSGQSSTVRDGPWRRPGLLEAALTLDGITAELIADNRHLPATLMKLAYKCLGSNRLCVVSDATPGAGMPEGTVFRLGRVEYEVHSGVGMTLDRTSFAGSTMLLNEMIPILVEVAEIPLPDAVRMATLTPATVLGLESRKGSIEEGKDADIAIFDEDFAAWRTMAGGRWIHVAEERRRDK
jgi:N-acetylglucosamine-6-phosphate deacetylase